MQRLAAGELLGGNEGSSATWAVSTLQHASVPVSVHTWGQELVCWVGVTELRLLRALADGSLETVATQHTFERLVSSRAATLQDGERVLLTLSESMLLSAVGVSRVPSSTGGRLVFRCLGTYALLRASPTLKALTVLDADAHLAYTVCASAQGSIVCCALRLPAPEMVTAARSLRINGVSIKVFFF